ncbi:S-layer homology domain-containing protein, partial [Lutispora sp.]|uniref:S-layer homology domain-containing protein n=1 Tax=Lutispora sp. TaxID=2828727 RepID=UPI002B20E3D3
KTGFSDEGNISSYAGAAVKSIASSGIMRGKGNNKFAPKDNATRAEAAMVLKKLLSNE